ncbi:MAG: tetratricopeptide repeat protein [Gloeomargaritaceae cyanobacterium C42_A2020_066]|nr:tetratricopeptide repeat protein [Gloeomargaritaceae cyanobacterium C42_A2020_066]
MAENGALGTTIVQGLADLAEETLTCGVGLPDLALVAQILAGRPGACLHLVCPTTLPGWGTWWQDAEAAGLETQIMVYDQEPEAFFEDWRELGAAERIGLYLYAGRPDYRSQVMGLLLPVPYLADRAMLIHLQTGPWTRLALGDVLRLQPTLGLRGDYPEGQVLGWDSAEVTTLVSPEPQPGLVKALAAVEADLKADQLLAEARFWQGQGHWERAEQKCHQALLLDDPMIPVYTLLAEIYQTTGRPALALGTLVAALERFPTCAELHWQTGQLLESLSQIPQAMACYRQALDCSDAPPAAGQHLARLWWRQNHTEAAINLLRADLEHNPGNLETARLLIPMLMEQDQMTAAQDLYCDTLARHPDDPTLMATGAALERYQTHPDQRWRDLGHQAYRDRRPAAAARLLRRYLQTCPGEEAVYAELGDSLWQAGDRPAALEVWQTGVDAHPQSGRLHFALITHLHQRGQTEAALAAAGRARACLPEEFSFVLLNHLLVPLYYETEAEIATYYQRFSQGLTQLIAETDLGRPGVCRQVFAGLATFTNFYLPFQGVNVRDLLSQFGDWVHQVMAQLYPQWTQTLAMPPRTGKIRVGYLSHYLHAYSGSLWLTGWLRYHDRTQFELYGYYTGTTPDSMTQELRQHCHRFHHLPGDLEALARQIRADDLHILVYPELGMDPPTFRTAGLRLAPVQCTCWGHPVTSGLPTIDYFLSSELMEPENGQDHYRETLIRLPHIGVSYPQPTVPSRRRTRADYHLPEDAVLYFCGQSASKYLPQYDWILPTIAQQVPHARFLFPRGDLLKARHARAFHDAGLDRDQYCIYQAIPDRQDYLALNQLADIYLDTLEWSGGNTSLEAIACGLPLVTHAGTFMRGLHTASFLRRLGLEETVADTPDTYVALAIDLGQNPNKRRALKQKLLERQHRLFDDRYCMVGLEDFFRQAAGRG